MNATAASTPMWQGGIPVLFEALPGPAADGRAMQEAHVDVLRPLRGLGVDALLVPEILDGQYATVEPRTFAGRLRAATGLPTSVACVTVHRDADTFDAWVADTARAQLGALLVGGESSDRRYPGLGVTDALGRAHGRVQAAVVTIPTRRRDVQDEPERLLAKQRAGAVHAVSQILYEPDAALRLQADLAEASRVAGTTPLPMVWSLAPVTRRQDISFLEWLGVEVPKHIAAQLRDAESEARRAASSLDVCEAIARRLLEHAEAHDVGPVGFCVEHVRQRNVDAAFRLVERVRDVVRDHGGLQRPAVAM